MLLSSAKLVQNRNSILSLAPLLLQSWFRIQTPSSLTPLLLPFNQTSVIGQAVPVFVTTLNYHIEPGNQLSQLYRRVNSFLWLYARYTRSNIAFVIVCCYPSPTTPRNYLRALSTSSFVGRGFPFSLSP